jgi:hypothetical protein
MHSCSKQNKKLNPPLHPPSSSSCSAAIRTSNSWLDANSSVILHPIPNRGGAHCFSPPLALDRSTSLLLLFSFRSGIPLAKAPSIRFLKKKLHRLVSERIRFPRHLSGAQSQVRLHGARGDGRGGAPDPGGGGLGGRRRGPEGGGGHHHPVPDLSKTDCPSRPPSPYRLRPIRWRRENWAGAEVGNSRSIIPCGPARTTSILLPVPFFLFESGLRKQVSTTPWQVPAANLLQLFQWSSPTATRPTQSAGLV